MFSVPPIPAWDALHPLVVHFPIALLLVAPVLILAAIVTPKPVSTGFALSALGVMVLGVASAFVAVSTGEAAGELADRAARGVSAAVEEHEELAETARTIFAVLAGVFAVLVVVPMIVRKKPIPRRVVGVAYAVFLVAYAPATLVLANAAHRGGVLVHEYGVHAMLSPSDLGAPPPPSRESGGEDDDDD